MFVFFLRKHFFTFQYMKNNFKIFQSYSSFTILLFLNYIIRYFCLQFSFCFSLFTFVFQIFLFLRSLFASSSFFLPVCMSEILIPCLHLSICIYYLVFTIFHLDGVDTVLRGTLMWGPKDGQIRGLINSAI